VQCFELIPTDTFFQFVPLVVSILVEVIHVDEDMVCITFGKANYLVNILILFCIRCFVFAEKVFKRTTIKEFNPSNNEHQRNTKRFLSLENNKELIKLISETFEDFLRKYKTPNTE
jgi:hypothetical protein